MATETKPTLPLPDQSSSTPLLSSEPSDTGAAFSLIAKSNGTKEQRRAYHQGWRDGNIEKVKLSLLKYKTKHPDRIRRAQAKSNAKNADNVRARKAAYRELHQTEIREYQKQYYAKNRLELLKKKRLHPEKRRQSEHKRRAQKHGGSVGDKKLISRWEQSWRSKRYVRCYWCRFKIKTKLCHTDHIEPLSKGGSHSIDNLCISCCHCNLSKNAKDINEWNKSLDQPVLL